jgi:hypothetical protein
MAAKGTLKSILSFTIAIVVAYFIIKILFGLLGFILKGLFFIIFIVIVAIFALPIYAFLKNKVFK